MFEYAATFTIIGADGTTVTLPDATNGIYLQDVAGFDSPNIRTSIEDVPTTDGARVGNFYYGSRAVTLSGLIGVNVTASTRNLAILNLQRAFRGMTGDVTIKATPSGLSAMQVKGRTQTGPRITGALVKDWTVGIVCPDPRIYSQTTHTTTTLASSATVCSGTWTNAGNYPTPWTIVVTGPCAANSQVNLGSLFVKFNTALTGGQTLTLTNNPLLAPTAVGPASANWYSKIVTGSTWFYLQPGANTVSLTGGGFTAGTTGIATTGSDAWA